MHVHDYRAHEREHVHTCNNIIYYTHVHNIVVYIATLNFMHVRLYIYMYTVHVHACACIYLYMYGVHCLQLYVFTCV